MIAIIDYGAGNLQSVKKALDYLGEPNLITAKSSEIEAADALVLPGVGSFGDAMQSLTDSGLLETVRAAALSDTPFLGICLGLQLLFPESEESEGVKGLGVLPGKIIKFPGDMGLKIPQIGWNSINIREGCKLYAGVPQNAYVYFVHSYYLQAADPEVVAATAEYGNESFLVWMSKTAESSRASTSSICAMRATRWSARLNMIKRAPTNWCFWIFPQPTKGAAQ